ncbi:GntR family transcriptional regulator [Pseudomonas sediminis]|uniref:GntR family transcriptional regulator n=1 Tax=Pseudomonas sediminis TaxID=1691904 RepID=A0ABX6SK36_9PSED|nr:GntR family transcriptional regulator [Pseudomonas sediminis]QNH01490.1 GntR family transcriptional regulator [Pseudomonas sediminis]
MSANAAVQQPIQTARQDGSGARFTSNFVYQSIYAAILEKRLLPTAKLDKGTLGRIFGVSEWTIQRALTKLAEEGAVTIEPRQVARVSRPSERQARQVLEARLLVEAEVIRQLGQHLADSPLHALHALVENQQRCLATGDGAGLIEQACQFHLKLAELAGNNLLLEFLRSLLSRSALNIALSRGAVYSARTCEEHLALITALEAGDISCATQLLVDHLNGVFDRMCFAPTPTADLHAAFKVRRTA